LTTGFTIESWTKLDSDLVEQKYQSSFRKRRWKDGNEENGKQGNLFGKNECQGGQRLYENR
jgi:hypothetical protein